MNSVRDLDVREIDKRFRKKIILNLFDGLKDGQDLELTSDHSLAPLHKLFEKEKNGFFEWRQLNDGPELWKISIKKVESLNLTINDIIKQFPFAIDILEKYSISYFKFGPKKLRDISRDASSIFEEIKQTNPFLVNPLRTDRWSLSFTVDYIINNHHTYAKEMIPEIDSLIDHLVKAHASTHPELPMIKARYSEFTNELVEHMEDEEMKVFPSFKKLENSIKDNQSIDMDEFDDTISWMEEDHILTGTSLRTLRDFCNNYTAPKESSPGFKILYEELKKFELDLHFHMHLENNVLFSKVADSLDQVNRAYI